MIMRKNKLYEIFHKKSVISKKIINENNFTYLNLIQIINRHLNDSKNQRCSILDLGCGVGTISFYLANKGHEVMGLDISEKAIGVCKKTSKLLNLDNKTKFIRADFQSRKIFKKFDLIICSEILEHLEDDKLALKKIKKLMNKSGLLIISVPSSNAPLYKIGYAKSFDKRVGHLRRYSVEQIKRLVSKENFEIIEIKRTEGLFRNFLFLSHFGILIKFIRGFFVHIFTLIDNLTIKLFGESQIFIVAKNP